ncbi:hypothetical protein J1N35_014898 [Gossypium stocksii]|uniref:Uncharacterized protein n=1 Tax=Gossypium stocksii TaxID=47602 RepID=A0A9D3VVJ6_9ROSI|nr:hypothetical protein J1N35_014898 [Gossypium stocksii]
MDGEQSYGVKNEHGNPTLVPSGFELQEGYGWGDFWAIIKKLQSTMDDDLTISVIVKEIKKKNNRFENLNFQFVLCCFNNTVHVLAGLGHLNSCSMYWMEEAFVAIENDVALQ